MQRARDRRLIVERGRPSPAYAFRHALIHETLYDGLLGVVAAEMHERIAFELERSDNASVAELAFHWGASRDERKAIDYNERAGDEAFEMLAFRDAIRFYGNALGREFPPGARRARLCEKFALALGAEGALPCG